MQTMESSMIKRAGYLASSQILDIEFHSGAVYRYYDIDDRVTAEFFTAGSPGRYYNKFIKGAYRSEKIV